MQVTCYDLLAHRAHGLHFLFGRRDHLSKARSFRLSEAARGPCLRWLIVGLVRSDFCPSSPKWTSLLLKASLKYPNSVHFWNNTDLIWSQSRRKWLDTLWNIYYWESDTWSTLGDQVTQVILWISIGHLLDTWHPKQQTNLLNVYYAGNSITDVYYTDVCFLLSYGYSVDI